jgi:hypothetical protein
MSLQAMITPRAPLNLGRRATYLARARLHLELQIRGRIQRQARLAAVKCPQARRVLEERLKEECDRERESLRVLTRAVERHNRLAHTLGYEDGSLNV